MSAPVRIAVVQFSMGDDVDANIGHAGEWVAKAAEGGANIVLLPELFASRYFPRTKDPAGLTLAEPKAQSRALKAMQLLARTHELVLPVSYFERAGDQLFNSLAVFDADGSEVGHYRKTHIPDGPGYEEKCFFSPGDSGFQTFPTRYGTLGVAICWDQWFPECARALALKGADILMYPTAIGSEPTRSELDTSAPWRRVQIGHAVANTIPVAAANRVGDEGGQVFYGTSFIADGRGDVLCELSRTEEGIAMTDLDLAAWRQERQWFGLLRDRRPDMYRALTE